jgi:hypothetical protein
MDKLDVTVPELPTTPHLPAAQQAPVRLHTSVPAPAEPPTPAPATGDARTATYLEVLEQASPDEVAIAHLQLDSGAGRIVLGATDAPRCSRGSQVIMG